MKGEVLFRVGRESPVSSRDVVVPERGVQGPKKTLYLLDLKESILGPEGGNKGSGPSIKKKGGLSRRGVHRERNDRIGKPAETFTPKKN